MKTFEQVYKEKFKGQLEKFIDKPLRVTNDLNYRPLEDDPNEVAVIIRTGPGTRSSIAGYDLTSLTFTLILSLPPTLFRSSSGLSTT